MTSTDQVFYSPHENFDTFSSFLHISSCINKCTASQFGCFLSKFSKTLENLDHNQDLLSLLKRNLISFVHSFIYKNENNSSNLDKILSSFSKSVRTTHNPFIKPFNHDKNVQTNIHYYDLSKGE